MLPTDVGRRQFLLANAGLAVSAQDATISRPDHDGMLLIKGRRTFLHGLYQLPNVANPLRTAADAGFRVIHSGTGADLDAAASLGMYGWVTTGSDAAKITAKVSQFGKHKALLFWETEDEPSYQWKKTGPRITPAVIRAAYAQLKKLDPTRAVYLNHSPTNLVSTLQEYNPGGDILATDIYPVIPAGIRETYALWPDGRQGDFLNDRISQVGQYMDKLRQVAGPQRTAVMVLQAFAWENLREQGRDAKMIRYPGRDEMRFMAFQSIVRGANGILWWGLKYNPADSPVWDSLREIARELRSLDDELAQPAAPVAAQFEYHDTGHSLDRGIEYSVKRAKDGPVMFAVNADSNPVEVTIRGVFRTPRRERFEPFGVRVLRAAPQ